MEQISNTKMRTCLERHGDTCKLYLIPIITNGICICDTCSVINDEGEYNGHKATCSNCRHIGRYRACNDALGLCAHHELRSLEEEIKKRRRARYQHICDQITTTQAEIKKWDAHLLMLKKEQEIFTEKG